MEILYFALIPFILARLCHLIGRAFGNKVGFSASLRAVVGAGVQSGFVALVVCPTLSFVSFNVAAVFTPDFLSETNRSHIGAITALGLVSVRWSATIFGIAILIKSVWKAVMLVKGVEKLQAIGMGKAIGTVLLSYLLLYVVAVTGNSFKHELNGPSKIILLQIQRALLL